MCCAHAMGVVGRFGLEQFGMREDDPKLVVQAVEESRKIACVRGGWAIFGHFRGVGWLRGRPSNGHQAALVGDDIRRPSGWRHSESVKMRMLPPAVRTYSTLPAAIQL